MTRLRLLAALTLASLLMAGCNLRLGQEPTTTPSPAATVTPTPSPRPTVAPLPTRQLDTPTATVLVAPHTDTPPATAPPSPSPSPAYFEYEVQADDTLMGIIQVFGYGYQLEVAQEVVRLNDSVFSIDFVPVGQTIRIPRPTATATPGGAEATVELLATIGIDSDSDTGLETGSSLGCHTVVANDTMVSIAERYNTTLEILSDLNSDLNWSGCNFTLLAGGEDCVPILNLGACIQVPQPTPLPTRFPTPTGFETPTPTATKHAPRLLYPLEGERINSRELVLQWVGVSRLSEGDVYLVELRDQTNASDHRQRTRANSYRVPAAFAPRDGEMHSLQWRVSVARQNEAGVYYFVGEQGSWRRFDWSGG